MFGLGGSYADDYEKNALAKYTDYVDNQALLIAMEGGLPASKTEFLSKHIKAGGSAESGLEAMEGIWPEAASAPTPNKIVEMRFDEEAGKEIPYDVYRVWTANGYQEVSQKLNGCQIGNQNKIDQKRVTFLSLLHWCFLIPPPLLRDCH